MTGKSLRSDVTVIGGGLVGMATAIGLAQIGLSVTIIDMAPKGDLVAQEYDGRSSALAYASCRLLDGLGIWDHMEPYAQPILEIRVSDGPSLFHLHFDNETLGDGPLGHMVENRHTRIALFKRLEDIDTITYLAPEKVARIERTHGEARVITESGIEVSSTLLLGCDGRNSIVRKHADIGVTHWGYGQTGIVCSIEHEFSHCGIAHERFLPSGPFAILPLTGNRSSLVWSEKDHLVETIMALGPKAFEAEVKKRAGDFLGDISVIGGRWAYPLTLQCADKFHDNRLALVGDAAHGMHPIAGQGLNLGLRDVAALLEVIADSARVGLDYGDEGTLERYSAWRHTDTLTLLSVTDVLTRLFSNDIAPVRHLRDAGLATVDKITPLKNFFMSHARGTVGDLPRLLRGEPL
ncbi:2-octaprenyl-3-methyl-6-methoxy-1,4-benzoquinol hydroxylase [Kordiimonas sediminis]|uniref:2-octaprenyl-3-methyl-6-methoxy-1,4-benzoquinol hydroxylase n=1 Tax=Kordiimonas sediminis TaxID=1735581 RepID=A0A919AMN5_9PROT|nr:UbiH/UbiF/VisC/COQ6 family ubiquinone biosynthesis hydroxylase [Kordiimonas sediminis]GHF15395.1 2-octaprenyl-3-methyl-6-methoxy-1,4-benzoquinol hydroxylase [Kordiimonas sediminis]